MKIANIGKIQPQTFTTLTLAHKQDEHGETLMILTVGWPESFLNHPNSLGLAEGCKSVSDQMVLLQHLGDGPEN